MSSPSRPRSESYEEETLHNDNYDSNVDMAGITTEGNEDGGGSSSSPRSPSRHSTAGSISNVPATPLAAGMSGTQFVPQTPLTPLSPGRRGSPARSARGSVGTPGSVFGGSAMGSPIGSPFRNRGSFYVNDRGNNERQNDDENDDNGNQVVIRGTDINVASTRAAFKSFLTTFKSVGVSKERATNPDYDEPLLPIHSHVLLEQIHGSGATSYPLDCINLYYHTPASRRLYNQLVDFPMEIVPIMDKCVNELYGELRDTLWANDDNDDEDGPVLQVRPYHFKTISHMRSLDPSHMDKMVTLTGMVLRCSPIIPDLKIAMFKCAACGGMEESTNDRGKIVEPVLCGGCSTKHSFEIVHNRCTFNDKQLIRLQETPDEVPAGETPASVTLFGYDDLVDSVRPGDRVEVTGIFRGISKRVNPKRTTVRTIFRTYIDVIHFRVLEAGESVTDKEEGLNEKGGYSSARIEEMEELGRRPDIYAALTKALAPSIWELDDVKRGVLAMLFGGNCRRKTARKEEDGTDSEDEDEDEDGGRGAAPGKGRIAKRGDVNILLCGDPGTSKSQLLGYVHKIAPRGVYTSGKGSSAVGLTASVVRDPETRELVLESGALVLSDKGVCCIDEFDKMSDTTRAILHEAMEQQTVSIAKAGIICSLNARCSILASANPLESRYNPSLSVVDNIKLPPTLLSRFDLIYLILDQPSAESDRRLAKHLVGLYAENVDPSEQEGVISQALLRDYIAYARYNIFPELSDLAGTELVNAYLEMRKMGGNPKTISATPRQLESLIRLAEALAKMRLSSVVERKDVQEAVRLMKVATQAAATDPRTGRIDMDMITTGRAALDRADHDSLLDALRDLLGEKRGNRLAVRDVSKAIADQTNIVVETSDIIEALKVLHNDGLVQYSERQQSVFVRSQIQ